MVLEILEVNMYNRIYLKENQEFYDNEGNLYRTEKGDYILETKWSNEVETKWEPPEGLFSKGSANEIANKTLNGHNGNVGNAIKAITFYLNRAGNKIDSEAKNRIENAKKILQNKLEK